MKRIGIDLDSTINNLCDEWVKDYNTLYNDTITPECFTGWDLIPHVKPECGAAIYSLLVPELFMRLRPLPYAIETIEWLSQQYELFIITACTVDTCDVKRKWIRDWLPCIDKKNVIITDRKGLVKVDYLIDDGPHNFEEFEGVSIVYDQPWNRSYTQCYSRVYNWREIKNLFKLFIEVDDYPVDFLKSSRVKL